MSMSETMCFPEAVYRYFNKLTGVDFQGECLVINMERTSVSLGSVKIDNDTIVSSVAPLSVGSGYNAYVEELLRKESIYSTETTELHEFNYHNYRKQLSSKIICQKMCTEDLEKVHIGHKIFTLTTEQVVSAYQHACYDAVDELLCQWTRLVGDNISYSTRFMCLLVGDSCDFLPFVYQVRRFFKSDPTLDDKRFPKAFSKDDQIHAISRGNELAIGSYSIILYRFFNDTIVEETFETLDNSHIFVQTDETGLFYIDLRLKDIHFCVPIQTVPYDKKAYRISLTCEEEPILSLTDSSGVTFKRVLPRACLINPFRFLSGKFSALPASERQAHGVPRRHALQAYPGL